MMIPAPKSDHVTFSVSQFNFSEGGVGKAMKVPAKPPPGPIRSPGRPKNPARAFWSAVQTQFERSDFGVVLKVREALGFDRSLSSSLIPFLEELICIADDLDVKTRFDLLSPNAKFNFVSLFCYAQHLLPAIPDSFLTDSFHHSLYGADTELPVHVCHVARAAQSDNDHVIPDLTIHSAPSTPEFFDELDQLVTRYPAHAASLLAENFAMAPVQSFYNSITTFFGRHRSLEGSEAVIPFVIRPFVSALESSANRLISDALIFVAPSAPEMLVGLVIQPILFDREAQLYQFELLQRLFKEEVMCHNALARLFEGRQPSLEAPLKTEALKFLAQIIPLTPPLPAQVLTHVMHHLRTQIGHDPDEASRLFVLLMKNQEIATDEHRELALAILEMLPAKMRPFARRVIEK
jgi:hypothetical protein